MLLLNPVLIILLGSPRSTVPLLVCPSHQALVLPFLRSSALPQAAVSSPVSLPGSRRNPSHHPDTIIHPVLLTIFPNRLVPPLASPSKLVPPLARDQGNFLIYHALAICLRRAKYTVIPQETLPMNLTHICCHQFHTLQHTSLPAAVTSHPPSHHHHKMKLRVLA